MPSIRNTAPVIAWEMQPMIMGLLRAFSASDSPAWQALSRSRRVIGGFPQLPCS